MAFTTKRMAPRVPTAKVSSRKWLRAPPPLTPLPNGAKLLTPTRVSPYFTRSSLIGGELLQRSQAGAGTDNGNQIAGTHLFVEEIPDCVADERNALAGQSEVIHHQRQRAAHFGGPHHERWRDTARLSPKTAVTMIRTVNRIVLISLLLTELSCALYARKNPNRLCKVAPGALAPQ
jgi:hypothetical protein